jgi:hypothetical protein
MQSLSPCFACISGMKKADPCGPAFFVFQALAGRISVKIRTCT